jgi:type II secretory ATPase GspE/PulE/Tfp pilus assembly ATPase PilB-like protein
LEDCSASPAVAVVDRLLQTAWQQRASDLHLDPDQRGMVVRMRKDGALSPLETLPSPLVPNIVGRLKAMADLLVYRTDVPQEGRIPAEVSHLGAEVRVTTYPTAFGERVSLRLVSHHEPLLSLPAIGLPTPTLAALTAAIDQPAGVLLLTGPSGSGKTTTLYACLHHLTHRERQRTIFTVEDPIERHVAGVTQSEVNEAAGVTFPLALRSILRQDPEVILIGEVRDRETATIALEAGLTGHLVVSTVHAGSSPLVFARLLELGVEPFALTTVVRGVLAQRLVRAADPDIGRILLAEWLPMSKPLRAAILARADGDELVAVANESGYTTLDECAATAVQQGRTTAKEVRHVLGTC